MGWRASRRLLAILLGIVAATPAASALAATTNVGYRDQAYGPVFGSVTESKPESKVWFNSGGWWASLLDPASKGYDIFRLDRATERWTDTGKALDPRVSSRADTLWDGAHNKLYVASHVFSDVAAVSTSAGRLYRYTYSPSSGSYTRDSGFPVDVNNAATETLVIARDSTGTMWATWTLGNRVYVNHTNSGPDPDRNWGTPYVLPVSGTDVSSDDISSVVAFGGNKIGVLWSNQVDQRFHFAVHVAGTGDSAFDWSAETIGGTPPADDHISLKADSAGRVYAAVKYTTAVGSTDPQIGLLVRDPAGLWTPWPVAARSESNTRPIVVVDDQHQRLHVFLTGPEPPNLNGTDGGTIYEKTSPMGSISFAAGAGTPVIRDALSPDLNDASSTKQNVDASSGVIVLANNPTTDVYWHGDVRLDGSTPPPPTPVPPRPPTGPNTSAFTSLADSQIRSNVPGSNYGALDSLTVKRAGSPAESTMRSYLKFAVSGLDSAVTAVKLRLAASTQTSNGGDVYTVGSDWSELGITWDNAPAVVESAKVGSAGAVSPGTIEINLDPRAVSGNGTYSFALAGGDTSSTTYWSREGAIAPELLVTTVAPPGTSTPPSPAPGPPAPPAAPPGPPAPPAPPSARVSRLAWVTGYTKRVLNRRYRRAWRAGRGRHVRCRLVKTTRRRGRIVSRVYVCRVSWRYRTARAVGHVTVVRRGRATSNRVRVRFIRHSRSAARPRRR